MSIQNNLDMAQFFHGDECDCPKCNHMDGYSHERTSSLTTLLEDRQERSILPSEAQERKHIPLATGLVDYFKDALAEVARVSYIGNAQHNPGMPVHWDRAKSTDEADALLRHFWERGTRDSDGLRHSSKMVWRALALLQKEIESDR